ncbi:nucleolar complex protein 4 homolog B-like [Oppia nitens]|uniref:nucleolar complex protein 4 homolog B-like n=1 Tax=Oppia nitens TaxID=1686743 RepID=UPI0023D9D794|nr:nucleolar complex protein 4 homolog B-like [Oppia nitens]
MDLTAMKQIEDIKRRTQLVIESRTNVNNIVDLLATITDDLDIDDTAVAATAAAADDSVKRCSQLTIETLIRSVNKIFIRFIHQKELRVVAADADTEANVKYRKWLATVYDQTNDLLIRFVGNNSYTKSTQKLAFNSLMKCVAEEGKYPFRTEVVTEDLSFPTPLFRKIFRQLLSKLTDNRDLIRNYCQNYLQFDDCVYQTLKACEEIVGDYNNSDNNITDNTIDDDDNNNSGDDIFVRNVYELLAAIQLKTPAELRTRSHQLKATAEKTRRLKPNKLADNRSDNIILCIPTQPNQRCFRIDYERDADLFASVWTLFLGGGRLRLPKDIYKKVLLLLDKQLIQHFRNPLLLTDFLVDSYSIGGIVSLLSLSSLYILIQKCNLEYPQFYPQLYALLTAGVLHVKYRPRFLFWLDIFLTSSHISAQTVASFVKRLSRIALTAATADSQLILLPMIGNLLVRHPSVAAMLTANIGLTTTESSVVINDPFDNSIDDPEATGASGSCLWELKTLQKHYHPQVRKLASQLIDKDLPNREWDLSELLETTDTDVMDSAIKSLNRQKQLTYDCGQQLWDYLGVNGLSV